MLIVNSIIANHAEATTESTARCKQADGGEEAEMAGDIQRNVPASKH
jgi:hypothetical protein